MQQFTKTALTFAILILLIFGLYIFANWFSRTTGYVLGEDEKTKLTQCLTLKGAVFYISETCPLCDKQLELFGESASEFLTIITCETPSQCPKGGVPAWTINQETSYGFKNFNELSELSGCRLE